jgi:glucose/arabinose dehydrogenase
VVQDGALLPTPFLDLSSQVTVGSEQGLLGLAFYPDYATSGRFVVHYSDLSGDTQVSSFQVSADPNVADAASEQTILTADQPYANHNGGQILFGPDGFLYLGTNDGSAGAALCVDAGNGHAPAPDVRCPERGVRPRPPRGCQP